MRQHRVTNLVSNWSSWCTALDSAQIMGASVFYACGNGKTHFKPNNCCFFIQGTFWQWRQLVNTFLVLFASSLRLRCDLQALCANNATRALRSVDTQTRKGFGSVMVERSCVNVRVASVRNTQRKLTVLFWSYLNVCCLVFLRTYNNVAFKNSSPGDFKIAKQWPLETAARANRGSLKREATEWEGVAQ